MNVNGSDHLFLLEAFVVASTRESWPLWLTVVGALTVTLGNVFNTWVVYKGLTQHRFRQRSFHVLVIGNSVQKGFVGYITWPILLYMYAIDRLPKNAAEEGTCSTALVTMAWLPAVGVTNNSLIALNRLLACYPNWKCSSRLRSPRVAFWMISAAWIVYFVLFIFPLARYGKVWVGIFGCLTFHGYMTLLDERPDDLEPISGALTMYSFATITLVGFTQSTLCYGFIVRRLFKPDTQASTQRKKDRTRAILVIWTVYATFLVCWFPMMTVLYFRPTLMTTYPIILYLPLLETMLSPLLFLVTVTSLRPEWMSKWQSAVSTWTQHRRGNALGAYSTEGQEFG